MPLYRRLPKRGFNPIKKNNVAAINLEKLQILLEKNIIKKEETINLKNLIKNKIIKKSYKKIKILGSGNIKIKLDIEADYTSKSAKEIVEKAGGKISIKKV